VDGYIIPEIGNLFCCLLFTRSFQDSFPQKGIYQTLISLLTETDVIASMVIPAFSLFNHSWNSIKRQRLAPNMGQCRVFGLASHIRNR
jgi:hypothetical protein